MRGVWNSTTKSCNAAGNPASPPPPCSGGIDSHVKEYARFTMRAISAINVQVTYPTLSAVAEGRFVN